ncbi:MAM and LDL-receptor class A domain-containing protein 1-like [Rana temporaria]|uniref:MAM and LDL-receptor class A domain-containing protein 1-like n=2 Tax=Rana temporaria TaxID=8407 RepID=UPI001AAD2F81|nr:MAM and LDL-receptor class A domain-containing protein 1-like [Rana temporaria]
MLSVFPKTDVCHIDCSFDVNLCNWKQSTSDNMDWIHWNGSTPSDFTGPSFDHTTGYGYYLYINGQDSEEGDFARLESPANCFTGTHCLQFWYHMYGAAKYMMLRVSVLRDYGLEDVFTIEGDHGDMWYLEKIFLPESDIIQIFIDGVRGEDFRSDVAIDDISFYPGYCTAATTTTTTTVTTKPTGSTVSSTKTTSSPDTPYITDSLMLRLATDTHLPSTQLFLAVHYY